MKRGHPSGSIRHLTQNGQKWCFVCQQYKDIVEFYHNRASKDGRASVCKACKGGYEKERQALYYLKHREELLPKHRESAAASRHRYSLEKVSKGEGGK